MIDAAVLESPTQSLQQITLQHADKRKLVVWAFPTRKPGQKDCIVFIPGTGGYTGTYLKFIKTLSEEFNVVSVDPTGHGLTAEANGKETRGKFTGTQIVDDVLLAVDWSKKKFGGNVGLLGTSQGGEIAARVMVRTHLVQASILQGVFDTNVTGGVNFKQRAARILPLFLVQAMLGQSLDLKKQLDWEGDLYLGAGYGSTFTTQFQKNFGREPSNTERVNAVKTAVAARFADPLSLDHYDTASYQSLLRYDWTQSLPASEQKDPIASYQGPVMLITGEKDHTIDPEFIQKIGARMTSPKKQIVVVPGGYHQLPLHNTREFMSIITPFFQKHL